MSPSSMKALGLSLMVLGFVIFIAMPFAIIWFGPVWTGLVFVFTAVVAVGAVLFGRGNAMFRPGFVPPPEFDVDTGMKGDIAPEQSTETVVIRGEIAPAPLAGVLPRPPTEPSAGSDEESR